MPNFRREKVFTTGRPQHMTKAAKAALMRRAMELSKRTKEGKHYGNEITAKTIAVLRALLFKFHGRNGLVFPSLDRIAKAADCARSTAALAIKALERAGLLQWRHRLKRVIEAGVIAVKRASNVYSFPAQAIETATESESRAENTVRVFFPTVIKPRAPAFGPEPPPSGTAGRQIAVSAELLTLLQAM